MKFQNYLENIAGIGFYPMFSLLVFVAFFLILFFWVISMKKEAVNQLANIPLDSGEKISNNESN